MKAFVLIFVVAFFFGGDGYSQYLPEHFSNAPLYDFLDELANDHVITIISGVKPYSRSLIAEILAGAESRRERLSSRQRFMLDMYLNEFSLERGMMTDSDLVLMDRDTSFRWSLLPPVLQYRDSLFRFSLRPVLGVRYFFNDNGNMRHNWGGAAVHAYVGSNWSAWASLRDNQQIGGRLAMPDYLTTEPGGNYKGLAGSRGGGEFSEMRGGIAWSWDWGSLSLEKDHLSWGDNYNGANIFSGRTPSYGMVKLQMNPAPWLNFSYHHGWLMSEVVDSVLSYYPKPGDPHKMVYRNKFIAANMFTITPFERLDISLGNAVIYSEMNVRPEYLVPFMFYKSVVHTQTHGVRGHNHNSAMFINVSSRQIRHLHLYGSWFVDEFSVSRIGDSGRTNFTSTKAGMRLSNWPLRDVSLTAEYTFTYPKTFQHRTPVTTYESNNFNMGHYLRDNARELFLAMQVRPWRGLAIGVSYLNAEKGNVVPCIYNAPTRVDTDPFMEDVVWSNTSVTVSARYLLYDNFSLFGEYRMAEIRGFDADGRTAQEYLDLFTPPFFHDSTNTFSFGVQLGF